MIFAHPWALWLIPVFVAGGGLLLWSARRRAARRLRAFGPPGRQAQILLTVNPQARLQKGAIAFGALLLLALAASRPMIGPRSLPTEQSGAEFFIALDVSKSMLVRDVNPDRLDAVKSSLSAWLASRHGDRIGLILIAGDAFVLAPLTNDYVALREVLAQTGPASTSKGGTNLASAIETAQAALATTDVRKKTLIIISDGDNLEGNPVAVAANARNSSGLTIFTVGVGTEEGGEVPVPAKGVAQDFSKPPGRFLRDEFGIIARSRLDERVLRNIAAAGGGEYFRFEATDAFWETLYSDVIEPMAGAMEAIDVSDYDDLFQIPVLLALLMLAAELAISTRRSKPASLRSAIQIPETAPPPIAARLERTANLAIAIPVAFSWIVTGHAITPVLDTIDASRRLMEAGSPEQAAQLLWDASKERTQDPYLIFNFGIASYASGDFPAAVAAFSEVAQHPKFGPMARFQLGNVHFRMGQEFVRSSNPAGAIVAWERAVEFYKRIENPDDPVSHNLEVTKQALASLLLKNGSGALAQAKATQSPEVRLQASESAFEDLNKASTLAPERKDLSAPLEEARKIFSRSLQEHAEKLAAGAPKADAKAVRGTFQEAINALTRAGGVDPDNPVISEKQTGLRSIASAHYAKAAEKHLSEARKIPNTKDSAAFRNQQKLLGESLANTTIALEFKPDDPKAGALHAEATRAMEDLLMASAKRMEQAGDTTAALNKRPDSAAARYTTALQNYQDALAMNPDNAEAQARIPHVQEKLAEQLSLQAQEDMRRAEVVASAPVVAQSKLLEGIGHLEKASQSLGRADALAPGKHDAAALHLKAQERLSALRNRLDQFLAAAQDGKTELAGDEGSTSVIQPAAPVAQSVAPLGFSEIRGPSQESPDYTGKERPTLVRDW